MTSWQYILVHVPVLCLVLCGNLCVVLCLVDPGQHATDALSGAGALCDEVRRYHAVSDLPTLTITPRTSESHHSRGQSI